MPWTERDRSIMGDVYRIMQKFADVPTNEQDGDVYWNLLTTTLYEFSVKWGINHLTVNAATFITSWLQDVYKEKRDAEWKIEAAAQKYREFADYGQPAPAGTATKSETNKSLVEKQPTNSPDDARPINSTPSSTKAETDAEINSKSMETEKGAADSNEYTRTDPRVRDGMLCFL